MAFPRHATSPSVPADGAAAKPQDGDREESCPGQTRGTCVKTGEMLTMHMLTMHMLSMAHAEASPIRAGLLRTTASRGFSPAAVRNVDSFAALFVAAFMALQLSGLMTMTETPPGSAPLAAHDGAGTLSGEAIPAALGRERVFAGYVGLPAHDRSDARLVRPDGTDLTLKNLRWDAEPFNFPLYAGVRYTAWRGAFGGMIDFLHDKAIARTGKGAHGRKVTGERAIVDTVDLIGTLKGSPAPAAAKLTDILERLEFSHGHNMLLPTALVRFPAFSPRLRPYAGIGAGAALPHVEVWPAGEGEDAKTNEYQAAGPAFQIVFGLEFSGPKGPIFLEYKYTYARLATSLTGGKTPSWCNCDIVTDFARHIANWWTGIEPKYGAFSTNLATHQLVAGAGYRFADAPASTAP